MITPEELEGWKLLITLIVTVIWFPFAAWEAII